MLIESLAGTGFTAADLENLQEVPELPDDIESTVDDDKKSPGTIFKIGEYSFHIERHVYDEWIEDIRQEHGFDEDSITNAVLQRLGVA